MALDKLAAHVHNAAQFQLPGSSADPDSGQALEIGSSNTMTFLYRRTRGIFASLFGIITRPRPLERSEQERKYFAEEVKRLRVYDYPGCPGSVKLAHTLRRLNLDIQYCDIRKCQVHRDNLLSQYGRLHAPCLRIEHNQSVQWLDEPEQIIHYLNQRFDPVWNEQKKAA